MGGVVPSYKGFLPGGDHLSLCVAVSPVPAQLPRGRRDDDGAGRRGLPRDHPAVVCEVRADLCQRARRRRARPGDKWHLNEVFIKINGKIHYLWQAVDQHGNVLDILVQSRRNTTAAKKFFRRLLQGLEYVPRGGGH